MRKKQKDTKLFSMKFNHKAWTHNTVRIRYKGLPIFEVTWNLYHDSKHGPRTIFLWAHLGHKVYWQYKLEKKLKTFNVSPLEPIKNIIFRTGSQDLKTSPRAVRNAAVVMRTTEVRDITARDRAIAMLTKLEKQG